MLTLSSQLSMVTTILALRHDHLHHLLLRHLLHLIQMQVVVARSSAARVHPLRVQVVKRIHSHYVQPFLLVHQE
jgi:hypothetical protein